jgi:alpha-1,4-digalacturonate transport system substrate-binding protein
MKKTLLATSALAAMMAGTALVPATASAQEIRFMCYSDGNECEVYDDVIDRFEEANPGVTVAVDVVPYQAILENLPVQLAAGEGPDLAKVTDLGGLNEYLSRSGALCGRGLLGRKLRRNPRLVSRRT